MLCGKGQLTLGALISSLQISEAYGNKTFFSPFSLHFHHRVWGGKEGEDALLIIVTQEPLRNSHATHSLISSEGKENVPNQKLL